MWPAPGRATSSSSSQWKQANGVPTGSPDHLLAEALPDDLEIHVNFISGAALIPAGLQGHPRQHEGDLPAAFEDGQNVRTVKLNSGILRQSQGFT